MSLSLKINIVGSNTVKTMRFSPEISVGEACQQIKEKVGEGGEDHGLFQAAIEGRSVSRWLAMEKSLSFYDLSSDSVLDYKKKHRPQKIKLLDETIKTQLIDDSTMVTEIVASIAKKMGIKNPEEYSLHKEAAVLDEKELKKLQKEGKEVDPNATEWLKPNQTLSEQGIKETDVLVFKKKFFFNDANIDRNDPVQLHLLFVQCRDAIVEGKYPTQREESIQLAAIQCQVALGDHAPQKHVPGYLNLKEYLPLQWVKSKGAEKDIYKEHRKLVSMTEVNAKYRYVQLCRSLKTYGMTSFPCKFRIGKKMADMTLGITREQMILIQDDTKEVIKTHPLKHIRRWASTDKSFTFDFGDHEQEYLNLAMVHPEEVSTLISGYIDIIMKSRRDPNKTVESNETGMAVEETVAIKRGNAASTQSFGYSGGAGNQPNHLSPSQQIPITDLKSALRATDMLINELNGFKGVSQTGIVPQTFSRSFTTLTPQQYKHQLISHSNAISTAASQLLADMTTQAQGGMSVTHQQMIRRAQVIMAELSTVGSCAKNAAFVPELASFSDEIIAVATRLSESMSKLLTTASTMGDSILADDAIARSQVHATNALAVMMMAAVDNMFVTESSANMVLECVKSVVNSSGLLVGMGNDKCLMVDDDILHEQLNSTLTSITMAGEQLMTVTENVNTTAGHPETRKLLESLCSTLSDRANHLMTSFKSSNLQQGDIDSLNGRLQDVKDSLGLVSYALDCVESRPVNAATGNNGGQDEVLNLTSDALTEEFASLSNDLTNSIMVLRNNLGNTPESILESFRVIASNSNRLISCTKSVAARSDIVTQQRLYSSTRAVFESVAHLSSSCKQHVKNPEDKTAYANVIESAGHLQSLTQSMSVDAGKIASIVALRDCSKDMISYVSALIGAARSSSSHLPDANGMSLNKASKEVSDALAKLMIGIKRVGSDPKSEKMQLELLELSQKQSLPPMNLVSTSKRFAPKIGDQNQKQTLVYASDAASQAVQRLMKTCETYKKICGHAEIEESLEAFDSTLSELETLEIAIQGGFVETIPGQTKENSTEMLMIAIKDLNRVNTELTTEIKTNPARLSDLVKNSTSTASQVAMAGRALISTTNGKSAQKKLLATVKQLTIDMQQLVRASRSIATNPGDPASEMLLDAASQDVVSTVASLVAASSHIDCKELDEASVDIGNLLAKVSSGYQSSSSSSESIGEYQEELSSISKALNASILQIISMARAKNLKGLGASSKITSSTLQSMVNCTNKVVQCNDCSEPTQASIISNTGQLCHQLVTLLDYAKARVANSKDPVYDQQLLQCAKMVEDTSNKLNRALGGGSMNLCDESIDVIIEATRLLDTIIVPEVGDGIVLGGGVHEMAHQQSLISLTTSAKDLGRCSGDIVTNSRMLGNSDALVNSSLNAANLIKEIVNSTRSVLRTTMSSAAPDVLIPSKQILDSTALIRATSATSAEGLPQVIQAARTIATATTQIFSVTKDRIKEQGEDIEESKSEIVQTTQALAHATSNLARGVKAVTAHEPNGQEILNQSIKELEESTSSLLMCSSSRGSGGAKDFARLLQACRAVSSTTMNVIQSASEANMKPKDSEVQSRVNDAAINMSTAMKDLLKVGAGMMPGVLLCEEAIDVVQKSIGDLSTMALSIAVGQSFENSLGVSHVAAQESMVDIVKSIGRGINDLGKASRQSPEQIGITARQLAFTTPTLVQATRTSLSTLTSEQQDSQGKLVNESKSLGDSLLKLCQASLSASTAPSKETYQSILNCCNDASDAMNRLVAQISSGVNLHRDLDEVLDSIKQSLNNLSKEHPVNKTQDSSKSYQDYKDEITTSTKDLAISLKGLISNTDQSNLVQISTICKDIASLVGSISGNVIQVVGTSSDQKIKDSILTNAKQVIGSTSTIVEISKQLSEGRTNQSSTTHGEAFKSASDGITRFLQAIKQGAIGEIQSDAAVESIKKIIRDIDASSLFAAAGQLESTSAAGTTSQAKQNRLKLLQKDIVTGAKLLIVTGSQLVGSSKGSQEHLGAATTKFAEMVTQLVLGAKEIASILSDTASQQDILSASKALSISSQQLVLAGKDAQRFKKDSTAFRSLGKAAEGVAEAVGQFISSVYFAISEAGKGLKELEKAHHVITSFVEKPDTVITNHKTTAEQVVNCIKDVAKSSIEIVTSYQLTQDDLVKSSQALVSSVQSLISNSKGATQLLDKEEDRNSLTEGVKQLNLSVLDLITNVREQDKEGNVNGSKMVSDQSRLVSENVRALMRSAKSIPGGEDIVVDDEQVEEDLELSAENELNALTKAIEEATQQLVASRPTTTKKAAGVPLDATDVAGIIVDASSSIAVAVAKLVQMAAVSQSKRRQEQQRLGSHYKQDPTWSNGLISAAKSVGGAVQMMINAAIKSTQGKAEEEELIATAREVAASTARLVSASRAKSGDDQASKQAHQSLMAAAKAVTSAISKLFEAAKQATALQEEEEEQEQEIFNFTGSKIKELEQQMKILRLEKELNQERKRLLNSRKQQYQQQNK